jgi:hypothetical protein
MLAFRAIIVEIALVSDSLTWPRGVNVADELVFTVSGAEAKPVRATTLLEIGLSERRHLQEWVLAHPEILGPDIRVVTFEFDRWWAAGGDPLDRLDVLGLDRSGRLVVAELKRDAAPDTVEMQAIKYAAMASRFTPETLGYQHARFLGARGHPVTEEEALAALEEHADEKTLAIETLRQPRVVLLAASFPPVVTATAVWLREMGLDITLMRFQAYRTDTETLVTVSQLLPVPTVEEFTVVPRSKVAAQQEYSTAPLDASEFHMLASVLTNEGMRGALDLSASRPGDWVTYTEVCEYTGRSRAELRADGGALTRLVKKTFGKNNWPFESQWLPDRNDWGFRLDAERAAWWTHAAASDEATTLHESSPLDHDEAAVERPEH